MQSMRGLWGKKVGMTQVFAGDKVEPVTAIDLSNWFITNIKTEDRDGYNALQVGCVKKKYRGKAFLSDWMKKPKRYFYYLREIKLNDGSFDFKLGQLIDIAKVIEEGSAVDIFGISKGAGFAGAVKRHGFSGGPKSHGSTVHRFPGSLGFMTACGRVIKGKKMPGHMGVEKCMTANLKIVKIDPKASLLLVRGSVPGKPGSLVFVRKH